MIFSWNFCRNSLNIFFLDNALEISVHRVAAISFKGRWTHRNFNDSKTWINVHRSFVGSQSPTHYRGEFISGNITICLHHFSTSPTFTCRKIVEIIPRAKQWPVYSIQLISIPLMAWRCKEPGISSHAIDLVIQDYSGFSMSVFKELSYFEGILPKGLSAMRKHGG